MQYARPDFPPYGPYAARQRSAAPDTDFSLRHGSSYVRSLVGGDDRRASPRRREGKTMKRARWPRSAAGGNRCKKVWVNVRYADSMDLLLDRNMSLGVRRDFSCVEIWLNIVSAFPLLAKAEITGELEASDARRGGLVRIHVKERAGAAYAPDRRYFVFVLVPPREGETRLNAESLVVRLKPRRKKGKRTGAVVTFKDEHDWIPYKEWPLAADMDDEGRDDRIEEGSWEDFKSGMAQQGSGMLGGFPASWNSSGMDIPPYSQQHSKFMGPIGFAHGAGFNRGMGMGMGGGFGVPPLRCFGPSRGMGMPGLGMGGLSFGGPPPGMRMMPVMKRMNHPPGLY